MNDLLALMEARAKDVRKRARDHAFQPDARSMIETEVGVVLDQLERARGIHNAQMSEIRITERHLSQEMFFRRYGHWMITDRLKQKLLMLQTERRRNTGSHDMHVSQLEGNLFSLLRQHAHLSDTENEY